MPDPAIYDPRDIRPVIGHLTGCNFIIPIRCT
jgi:hypothetical protein